MALNLSIESERVLVVSVSGKLVKEDYEHLVPEVDRLIREHGKIRILFQMQDFHGWTTAAMWEDTKFGFRHLHDLERLAMIGETRWQKGMAVFCRPFTKAEVRYFDHAHSDEARRWVQEQLVQAPTTV